MTRPLLPCQTRDPDYWFPLSNVPTPSSELAIQLCLGCPIQEACLDHALTAGLNYGIWGGYTEEQRRVILRRRGVQPRRTYDTQTTRTDLVVALASVV